MTANDTMGSDVDDGHPQQHSEDSDENTRTSRILRLVFYGVLAFAALVLLNQTRAFGDNPIDYGLPRALTVLFMILITIQVIAILRPEIIERFKPSNSIRTFDEFADNVDDDPPSKAVLKTVAWLVGFIVLLNLVGYLIAIPIFVGAYVWYYLDLKRAIVTTIIFSAGGYVLFIHILGVTLNEGWLIRLLGS